MFKHAVALSALLALGLSTAAMAQDKPVQLKLSHWVPPSHPLQGSMQAWAASIQKASNGTITSALFPAEQLGKAFDHYDMARDGIADVTYVNPGYQPGRFPIIAAGELPFTFADAKNGTAALDAWYRKYAAAEMKDVHFCMAFIHDPGAIHARKKVVTPDDIKGLKVRPANATIGQMVTLLGGTNVQASAPESRDMLERGVADAITFPWGSVILFGIDKVVKYHLDAPLYATTFVWVMNKAKYDGLSPAQKTVIDNHCNNEWAVRVATPWADFEASGRDRIRNMSGHEMIKLTPEQLGQWRTSIEPLGKMWADGVRKTGGNPDEMAAELKESVAKYKAGL